MVVGWKPETPDLNVMAFQSTTVKSFRGGSMGTENFGVRNVSFLIPFSARWILKKKKIYHSQNRLDPAEFKQVAGPNQPLNFRLTSAKMGRAAPRSRAGPGSGTGVATGIGAKDHCAVYSFGPLPSFGSAKVNVPSNNVAV